MQDFMKYTIIIPTFNSEKWIQQCINSVLAQTCTEFDVVILDSGSSDTTIEWLYSLANSRIRIYTAEHRLGIVENWQRILSVPRNEFMTILGHDDILNNNYLETIDALIREFPDADLYQTHFNFIDGEGVLIRPCLSMKTKYTQQDFFEAVLKNAIEVTATGFMVRSHDYDSVGGIPDYPHLLYADIELWQKLIGAGYLAVSPQNCFSFRFHIENTSKSSGIARMQAFERMADYFKTVMGQEERYKKAISENGLEYLKNFVVGSCHKLIYVPASERKELTIDAVLSSAKRSAAILLPDTVFIPEKFLSVKLAKFIDRIPLAKKIFLWYKSFFKRTF